MSDAPLISIVTPGLNCAPYIRGCIESVLAQDHDNLEHIVADGGSTDGTLDILRAYPHLRWISQPDGGEAEALNKALRMAKGAIIGWLNADDWYAPGALRTVAAELDPARGRHVIYGKAQVIGGRDAPIDVLTPIRPVTMERLVRHFYDFQLCQPTMFYSREVVERVGPFREDLHFSIDYDYWLRIVDAGYRFHYVDAVLANIRPGRADAKSRAPRAAQSRSHDEVSRAYRRRLPPAKRVRFQYDYAAYVLAAAARRRAPRALRDRVSWLAARLALAFPAALSVRALTPLTFHLLHPDKRVWLRVRRGLARGLWMRLNARTEGAVYHGRADAAAQNALGAHVRAGMVVYDVGAGTGACALGAARLAGSTGAVYAFETHEVRRVRLQQDAARNALGTLAVVACEAWPGTATSAETLDDFADRTRPPDVIRCDIAGAAVPVMESATRILACHRPAVICRLESSDRAALKALFERAGYHVAALDATHALALPPTRGRAAG